jgi:multidrug transporter EmrE-like cation transporter
MSPLSFALVLSGVLLNAAAQLLLKAGTNNAGTFSFTAGNLYPIGIRLASDPCILGGLGCYALSVVIWIMALSRVEVSLAYPMLSIGYVINAFAAWYLFGEALGPQRMAGIGAIMVGVFLVARS